ncbi:unnamed protein product [Chrysoparadoxa australica]
MASNAQEGEALEKDVVSTADTKETAAQKAKQAGRLHKECVKMRYNAIGFNPTVKFMLQKIQALGCELPDYEELIQCVPCGDGESGGHTGGFSAWNDEGKPTEPRIVLCENTPISGFQFVCDQTIVHELVHAYDQCRAKVDWSNCSHHACSEIRASSLSGECRYTNELLRGNWKNWAKHHRTCVKRRAKMSVEQNLACKGKADAFVEAVFDACYEDTAPFDWQPRG